jgi:hypothetical protein
MRIAVCAVGACAVVAMSVTTLAALRSNGEDDPFPSEKERLRTHFDSVLIELRNRDVSGLDAHQRRTRAQLIGALERYRNAGVFPHNHDFPGERVPYFRDAHGTLCAMAYLVAATGRSDLVDGIAHGRNNAHIPELADDRRLLAWLDSVGLTVAEAARIQPAYRGPPIVVTPAPERGPERYIVPSAVLGIPALVTAAINWNARPGQRRGAPMVIGAITGAATSVLGVSLMFSDAEEAGVVGLADFLVGSAALVSVVNRSMRGEPRAPPPIAGAESRLSLNLMPRVTEGRVSPTAEVRLRF